MKSDIFYLRRAIELSKRAPEGRNYKVGAVLVRDGNIIKESYSWEFGEGTHAEENVLRDVKGVRGAELYCSMEPCSSRSSGKELCTQRIFHAGISRVIYACSDPDDFKYTGHKFLQSKGIKVFHLKDLERLAQSINPHLFRRKYEVR